MNVGRGQAMSINEERRVVHGTNYNKEKQLRKKRQKNMEG